MLGGLTGLGGVISSISLIVSVAIMRAPTT
jgi:hypothetical protein